MVAGTEGVRRVERKGARLALEARLAGILDGVVVVEQRHLVGVGVPGRGARYLAEQRRVGQRIVEVAELAVEDVRVGVLTHELLEQVGVASLLERRDRPLVAIAVQVPDHQHVRVTAAGRVGGQPVGQRLRRGGAGPVAVGRAVER